MSRAMIVSAYAAGGLVMISAFFGAVLARLVWAYDLKHAMQLRQIWDQTEGYLRTTIAANERSIAAQKEIIRVQDERIKIMEGRQ